MAALPVSLRFGSEPRMASTITTGFDVTLILANVREREWNSGEATRGRTHTDQEGAIINVLCGGIQYVTDTPCPYLSKSIAPRPAPWAHRGNGGAGTASVGAQTRHRDGIPCPQASWTVYCRYLHTHGHALALPLSAACLPAAAAHGCLRCMDCRLAGH